MNGVCSISFGTGLINIPFIPHHGKIVLATFNDTNMIFSERFCDWSNKKFRLCYDVIFLPSPFQPKCKGPKNFSKNFICNLRLRAKQGQNPDQTWQNYEKLVI